MQNSERKKPKSTTFASDAPFHPQAKVEHYQREWSKVWNPLERPVMEDLAPWIGLIPSCPTSVDIKFSG